MAKKIRIDVEVNGKMQKAEVSAKKLRAALGGVESGYQRAGAAAGTFDRRTKGAAQATANGTKEFSKMSQGMGGLVGAYATVAASVFALSAAFNFLKNAADLDAQIKGQELFAARTGVSMKLMTQNIQEATGGLVAFKEAAQAAAIGQAAGLTADQMERLGKVAKNAGTILGRDVTDSFNRLTRGAIKAEPELLDELGIIVRIKDASEEYAKTIGKNASDLTTYEKSQAVVNAVLEQGEQKFGQVGNAVNQVAAFGAKFRDTFKDMAGPIADVANFFAGAFKDSILAVSAVFGILGVSIIRSIMPAGPALASTAEAAKAARKRMQKAAGDEQKSRIAGEIKAGNFTKRVMRDIERSLTAKHSKVINYSKVERAQIQRDLLLIRADQLRTTAEGSNAWNRYFLNIRAQLATTQAEFGKFFGFVRFAGAGLGNLLSKAFGAASFIGIGIMLFELGKQFRQTFLISKELREAEQQLEAFEESIARQTKEITKVRDELSPATDELNKFAQLWGVISNYNLAPLNEAVAQLRRTLRGTGETTALFKDLDPNQQVQISDRLRARAERGRTPSETRAVELFDSGEVTNLEQYTQAVLKNGLAIENRTEAFKKQFLARKELESFDEVVGDPALAQEYTRALRENNYELRVQKFALEELGESFDGALAKRPSTTDEGKRAIAELKKVEGSVELLKDMLSDLRAAGIALPSDIEDRFNEVGNTIAEGTFFSEQEQGAMGLKSALMELDEQFPGLLDTLSKAQQRNNAALASFNSITQAVTAFGDASDKAFTPKESQFTALYGSIDEITNSVTTLLGNLEEGFGGKTISELIGVDDEGKPKRYSEQINAFRQVFSILADDQGKINGLKFEEMSINELMNALGIRRVSIVEAELRLIKEKNLLQVQYNKDLRTARDFEKDRLKAAFDERIAANKLAAARQALLQYEQNTTQQTQQRTEELQRAIDLAESEYFLVLDKLNLEKELANIKSMQAQLSIDSKILNVTREIGSALEKEVQLRKQIQDLSRSEATADIQEDAAEKALLNPFFDKEKYIREEMYNLELSLVSQKITQAQEEYNRKVQGIGLEYDLLKAKRLQTKFELKALAADLRSKNRGREADEILRLAERYDVQMRDINARNKQAALDLARDTYFSQLRASERTLKTMERAKIEASALSDILDSAGKAFSSALTDSITAALTNNGEEDISEKIKGIFRSALDSLLKTVVQRGIVDPLLEQLNFDFLKDPAEQAMRGGADYTYDQIIKAFQFAANEYLSPTDIGRDHYDYYRPVIGADGINMNAAFGRPTTYDTGIGDPISIGTYATDYFRANNGFGPGMGLDTSAITNGLSEGLQPSLNMAAAFGQPTTMSLPGVPSMASTAGVFGEGNPIPVSVDDAPALIDLFQGGGVGANGSEAVIPGGDSGGKATAGNSTDKNTKAVEGLTIETAQSHLQTASMVTATAALGAQLLGNERAAQALMKVMTLLQFAVMALEVAVMLDAVTPLTKFGGIVSNGRKLPGYNNGGIARGPHSGYMVEMHGTEAVVPLPRGNEIPVEIRGGMGGSQQNNVTVNVAVNNDGSSTAQTTEEDNRQAREFGKAITFAVQKEMQKQKRAGGILNPYGA